MFSNIVIYFWRVDSAILIKEDFVNLFCSQNKISENWSRTEGKEETSNTFSTGTDLNSWLVKTKSSTCKAFLRNLEPNNQALTLVFSSPGPVPLHRQTSEAGAWRQWPEERRHWWDRSGWRLHSYPQGAAACQGVLQWKSEFSLWILFSFTFLVNNRTYVKLSKIWFT